MRKVSIKEMIKAVPLDPVMKQDLLKQYDSYDDERKFEIIDAYWRAFDDMYEVLKEATYQQLLGEVAEGTRKLDSTFKQAVDEAAWQEMEEYISGKKYEIEELKTVREQLVSLINKSPQQT